MSEAALEFSENEVRELIGGIGAASPGPLFLVDHLGRTHPLNGLARTLAEGDAVAEAFVSPVRLGASRSGRIVGYTRPGGPDDEAAMVSALVALAAGVVGRRLDPERRGVRGPRDAKQATLDEACEQLTTLLDETAVADVVASAARRASSADLAVVLLPDDEGRLELAASSGDRRAAVRKTRPGVGVLGLAATRTTPLAVDSLVRLPGELRRHDVEIGPRCPLPAWIDVPFVAVPLLCGPQLAGLLVVSGLKAEPGGHVAEATGRVLQRLADRASASLAGARVIRQVRREERVARELEIARQIQSALIAEPPTNFTGLDIAGECRAAAQVGGDFFGFRRTGDDEMTAALFDVAGHGIGAAFCMTLVRSALYGELARGGRASEVLARTNERVFDDVATSGLFATAFLARFDRREGVLRYASAGHARPVHWSASRRAFTDLGEGGLPLGLLPDGAMPDGEAAFGEGDVFVAYTDGVVEATNANGEPFGRHRLLGIVQRTRRRPARTILRRVWRELESFVGARGLPDDATLTVIRGAHGFGKACSPDRAPRRVARSEVAEPARGRAPADRDPSPTQEPIPVRSGQE